MFSIERRGENNLYRFRNITDKSLMVIGNLPSQKEIDEYIGTDSSTDEEYDINSLDEHNPLRYWHRKLVHLSLHGIKNLVRIGSIPMTQK